MRKLVKIFMTVVAGMMVFSCATDTTDDLGVNLGKGQKTVISVSLEESRTYLGGYNEDAKKYPMYWSEGDKISANGVVSEAAQFTGEQSAVALFEFPVNANLTKPYFVTYPAVANAEGKWQVKFAAEQKWIMENDTFDEGVSTMYGYSEKSLNVQMNHLTGILKIGITGSDRVTLEKVQISTVDRKPIAGTFDFTFETDAKGNKVPKLTPTADAKSVIEYSFGDIVWEEGEGEKVYIEGGQGLSSAPTYIHVAVPAGIYDELYVTLYDINGGVMYATVKAGDTKPLKAGQVREFKKGDAEQFIEYTPTADNVYIVSDAGTLAGVKENLDKIVVMVADVDMTNETWTSIDGFAGEFYGNGYAIKGLKAPLFGTTTASVIKGVHLEDVDIESSLTTLGALACKVDNTEAEISHCSAEGTLLSTGYTTSTGVHQCGGIIGWATTTGTIDGLVNRVNVTNDSDGGGYFAGCVGRCTDAEISNSQNYGTISVSGTSSGKGVYIAGVTGHCSKVSSCTNGSDLAQTNANEELELGEITYTGLVRRGADKSIITAVIGGVACMNTGATTASGCTNYATINANGAGQGGTETDATNGTNLTVGGVLGSIYTGCTCSLSECNNYGVINISHNGAGSGDGEKSDTAHVMIGGINSVSGSDASYSNCHNYGDINVSSSSFGQHLFLGGISGCIDSNGTISNLSNNGEINVNATCGGSGFIGGIAGRISTCLVSGTVKNTKPVTINGSYKANTFIGGIIGYFYNSSTFTPTNATLNNSGEVTFNGTLATNKYLNLGGIIGGHQNTITGFDAIINTGDVELTQTATVTADREYVGGIFGGRNNITTGVVEDARCYCTVKAIGRTSAHVGMITGRAYNANCPLNNCKVGGSIWKGDATEAVTLTGENYYNYIYGSGNSADTASGCEYWNGTEE